MTCRSFNRQFYGGYELMLLDGTKFTLSRRHLDKLEKPSIGCCHLALEGTVASNGHGQTFPPKKRADCPNKDAFFCG